MNQGRVVIEFYGISIIVLVIAILAKLVTSVLQFVGIWLGH